MTHTFITGVTAGLGAALTRQLCAPSHQVSGVGRRADRLQALAATHPEFLGLTADVADSAAMGDAVTRAEAAHGPIDVAILNAGLYQPVDGKRVDSDVFRRHMEVNYMGVVHALDAIIPAMVARRHGHIVIVASVAGWSGLPKSAAYGPTKAALISLAESLWFDLTPTGIKIQVVCPGFIETEATAQNDFDMPGLMTADDAASAMIAGMASSAFEVAFPKSFTRTMRLLKFLPYSLYFALMRRRTGF
ncbi:MAG: SDR family NAD(P)-dependent oxidoreductase [Alphaproteobacteria bacterium]|nr:SDR family NAD(P)-dependent oxidoreductase [Alphaproteobacteria bacterium]